MFEENTLLVDMGVYTVDFKSEKRTVQLSYTAITRFACTAANKNLTGPGGFGNLGYEEIELVDDACFEHRWLFSSGIEMNWQFAGFYYSDESEYSSFRNPKISEDSG